MKHTSLQSVEVVEREDYSKRVLFDAGELPGEGHVVQVVTIPPQTKQRAHYHKKQTEVFFILEGECLIVIDDKEFTAKPGDAFVCEPGDTHYLHNETDAPFRLIVFKIGKPADEQDSVWVEE